MNGLGIIKHIDLCPPIYHSVIENLNKNMNPETYFIEQTIVSKDVFINSEPNEKSQRLMSEHLIYIVVELFLDNQKPVQRFTSTVKSFNFLENENITFDVKIKDLTRNSFIGI